MCARARARVRACVHKFMDTISTFRSISILSSGVRRVCTQRRLWLQQNQLQPDAN